MRDDFRLFEIDGLARRFGGVVVLDCVDLVLGPGRAAAVVGPNGSGKTTLLRCAVGPTGPTRAKSAWTAIRCVRVTPVPGRRSPPYSTMSSSSRTSRCPSTSTWSPAPTATRTGGRVGEHGRGARPGPGGRPTAGHAVQRGAPEAGPGLVPGAVATVCRRRSGGATASGPAPCGPHPGGAPGRTRSAGRPLRGGRPWPSGSPAVEHRSTEAWCSKPGSSPACQSTSSGSSWAEANAARSRVYGAHWLRCVYAKC